jgi:hypothetical protein
MRNEARPVSPEPARTPEPDAPATTASPPPHATGPHPQSAFTYPDAPESPRSRSRGTRMALLIIGAVVVAGMLFGGGFWTGSVVSSIPGMSHSRFGDDPRMGPGGPGDPRPPGREDDDSDSDTDTDTTDPSNVDG